MSQKMNLEFILEYPFKDTFGPENVCFLRYLKNTYRYICSALQPNKFFFFILKFVLWHILEIY